MHRENSIIYRYKVIYENLITNTLFGKFIFHFINFYYTICICLFYFIRSKVG